MSKIVFQDTHIPGLKLITPFVAADHRGWFLKCFEKGEFEKNGIRGQVSESFESFSKKGVIRGMHYQMGEYAQAKLVRVLLGEVFDVCVDLRPQSPTFGQWTGEFLSEQNHKAFYIEKGLAHGFLTISENALMSYTCFGAFTPEQESGIRYDDPTLGIVWPLSNGIQVIQSDRDANLQTFNEYCASIEAPVNNGGCK